MPRRRTLGFRMGSGLPTPMRSARTAALALTLLVGSLAGLSTAIAQDGSTTDELSFDWTCHALVCQFETTNAEQAVEGNVTAVDWTFGPDGNTTSGNPVEHTFPEPGTYDVTVTVTGNATGNGTDNGTANASTATTTGEVSVSNNEVPWMALGVGAAALVGSLALARMT